MVFLNLLLGECVFPLKVETTTLSSRGFAVASLQKKILAWPGSRFSFLCWPSLRLYLNLKMPWYDSSFVCKWEVGIWSGHDRDLALKTRICGWGDPNLWPLLLFCMPLKVLNHKRASMRSRTDMVAVTHLVFWAVFGRTHNTKNVQPPKACPRLAHKKNHSLVSTPTINKTLLADTSFL